MIENTKQFQDTAEKTAYGVGNTGDNINAMAQFIRDHQGDAAQALLSFKQASEQPNLSDREKMQLNLEVSAIDAAWAKMQSTGTDCQSQAAVKLMLTFAEQKLETARNVESKKGAVRMNGAADKLDAVEKEISAQLKGGDCH